MNGFFASYIGSVTAVSLTALICDIICSSKTGEKMTRALNLIISLCVFMTVIMPVVNSFRFFTDGRSSFEVDFSGTPSQTQDTFTDLWKEETEKDISNAVFRKNRRNAKIFS